MKVTIKAYRYEDLDDQSKIEVLAWLEEGWEYSTDRETQDIIEHCEANEYLFNKLGEPIHHLIEG